MGSSGISAKEGETVNVGALLGSISQSKSATTSLKNNLEEKKYSPPKIEENEPNININKPEQNKKAKKKSLDLRLTKKKSNFKVFNDEPLILEEEPLILDEVHK